MKDRILESTFAFVVGMASGWLAAAGLLVLNVSEPWAITAGWVVFFVATAAVIRVQRHHETP